jgi:NAD(P)-dependent dehydrogenase (short-subunit alcohol dehydrogenase family)
MKEGLDGRAVLIFGASGALGSGVAAAFASAGAAVIEAGSVRAGAWCFARAGSA